MKFLTTILILLFTSPAFASDFSNPFMGAHGVTEDLAVIDAPDAIKRIPDAEEPEFKIDERLYLESIGSYGYDDGGFYSEEKYAAQIDYFAITSNPSDFVGIETGFNVVDGQISPFGLSSPFLVFTDINSGIFSGRIGGFTFFRVGSVGNGFGHGSFGFRNFGRRHR